MLDDVEDGDEDVEDVVDVLELEVDEEVLEDEDEVEVLETGVLELALELLRDKKDDDVVDGVEVADAVIIEAPVGVLHIVVFDIEYPSGTKSEVDDDEVLELLVVFEDVEVELEVDEVELEDVVLCTL